MASFNLGKLFIAHAVGVVALLGVAPTNASDVQEGNRSRATIPGTFTETGQMTTARSLHTSTLLADGRILVAGGAGAGGESATILSSAEIYYPVKKRFIATHSMSTPRTGAAAVRLPDGRVFMAGGEDNSHIAIRSVELYNPSNGRWTLTSPMQVARVNPTATLLQNGKVLVVGGYSRDSDCCPLGSAEIYDPERGTFSSTGSLRKPRRNHTATLLEDGRVLVAGGYDGLNGETSGDVNLNAPELYDPRTGTFSDTGLMSTARRYPTATMLLNGEVLLVGGYGFDSVVLSSADLYSTKNAVFSPKGSMLTPRGRQTATRLVSGKVLVAGGYDDQQNAMASAELYDPVSGAFSVTGSMATPRWRHAESRLPNGDVLITGGSDGTTAVASAELYASDPAYPSPTVLLSAKVVKGNGSIISDPAGIECGSVCLYGFTKDMTVSLTALPALGASFAGWSGACRGSELTCSVTLKASKSVKARFN